MRVFGLIALSASLTSVAAAQVTLSPKVGVSIADMKSATADVDTKSRLGYQAGVDLRLGLGMFIQPGVHYQQTGLEQNLLLAGKYNLDVRGYHIPVLVGVKAGVGVAGIRIAAGPALTLVQSVKDNAGGITKDDLAKRRLGGMVQVGVDALGFTADLSGEAGLTKFFETGRTEKLRTMRLSVGWKF